MTPALCAGCSTVLPPQTGPGRRRIYCSPRCRARTVGGGSGLVVEVDHEPTCDGARPAGRVWTVRLRRGRRQVVVASELGRPSAEHLADEIAKVIGPRRRTEGGAID